MPAQTKLYLDYNATTPVDRRVLEEMWPYFTDNFGNASSDHVYGWDANEAVELARDQIAELLNCRPLDLTFTSGATEAANLALIGFCEKNKHNGNHIISCRTEHKAVLDTLAFLEQKGYKVTYLKVDTHGNIDLDNLRQAISSDTILVCLMLANNETGIIHPIPEIEQIVHRTSAKLMSDITQAAGKIPVDLKKMNIDLAILSSHKMYGPKGIGAVFTNKKEGIEVEPSTFGGGQEKGLRPGTLNVPAIVGFGKAAEIALNLIEKEAERLERLKNRMENALTKIEGAVIHGNMSNRLPNTTNISFKNIDGHILTRRLKNLAVSRGSACSSNLTRPSHVLKAMGLSDELALSSIRISLGRATGLSDIDYAINEIGDSIQSIKSMAL